MPEPDLLFVYGTLRRGCDNPHRALFDRCTRFVGEACAAGRLYVVAHYPGAVPSAKECDRIVGEVFRISSDPEALFRVLDEYEGCFATPPLYRRAVAEVRRSDHQIVQTNIYWYLQSVAECERVLTGDWMRWDRPSPQG